MVISETPFSTLAWARNQPLYNTILAMPFIGDLQTGTLSIEKFRHYIVQDAHYLIGFGQALAIAAAKSDDPDHIVQFSRAAETAVLVERELHADYFRRFGLDEKTVAGTPLSAACHHYIAFLIANGFRAPLAVHLAGLLPCFWAYREVGRRIHGRAAPENPYRAWIDTYAGDDFAAAVDAMIAVTDALGSTQSDSVQATMHTAFTRAMQLEWMFWDSAYRLEHWPV